MRCFGGLWTEPSEATGKTCRRGRSLPAPTRLPIPCARARGGRASQCCACMKTFPSRVAPARRAEAYRTDFRNLAYGPSTADAVSTPFRWPRRSRKSGMCGRKQRHLPDRCSSRVSLVESELIPRVSSEIIPGSPPRSETLGCFIVACVIQLVALILRLKEIVATGTLPPNSWLYFTRRVLALLGSAPYVNSLWASKACPELPKKRRRTEVSVPYSGSGGAIGRHNSTLKIDVRVWMRPASVFCARTLVVARVTPILEARRLFLQRSSLNSFARAEN